MEQKQIVSRLGCFTASEIGKLLGGSKTKGQLFGETALTYIDEKIAEVITGERKASASSASLDWGISMEKDAFLVFQTYHKDAIYYGKENFKYFEFNAYSGGSPDGQTNNACIEIKNPFVSANHIKVLRASKLPEPQQWLKKYNLDYYTQLQFNMLCMKLGLGYFVSYDPRTSDYKNRLAVIQVVKDEELITELTMRIEAAANIVRDTLALLK